MKICPKCNKEWSDEIVECPMDQTPLVVKPQQPAGFSLNLGDANAISGGVNLSDNHSVSNNIVNTTTSNVDSHNVITNNITHVEREKTPEEIKHEKELTFREECINVYSNGIMTSEDKRKLEDLQYSLGLDETSASRIIAEVAKRTERKSTSLSPVHQITFNNIKTAINANRLDLVNRLMAQMKVMVQRSSVEEIQFTYYMLQAILHPKECIKEYECQHEDIYWQTFWTSIAYKLLGDGFKSGNLASDLWKWKEIFPEENEIILGAISFLLDKDLDTAKLLYDNISGEHSQYLSSIATCIYTLLYGDMLSSEELKQWQKDCVFYANNLFAEITTFNSEQKRLQEEADTIRIAEEKRQQEEVEAKCFAEEKQRQEEAEAKHIAEEKQCEIFNEKALEPFINDFGYVKNLNSAQIAELKSILQSAPKDNYQVQFHLGQLYIQESNSAVNLKLAYDAIKLASEHGVYEAGAYMAYFYLYGKVVIEDLDEAERRIKLDDDYKKNPIYVQMLVDLYNKKGNEMLADVWKSKLKKLQ